MKLIDQLHFDLAQFGNKIKLTEAQQWELRCWVRDNFIDLYQESIIDRDLLNEIKDIDGYKTHLEKSRANLIGQEICSKYSQISSKNGNYYTRELTEVVIYRGNKNA